MALILKREACRKQASLFTVFFITTVYEFMTACALMEFKNFKHTSGRKTVLGLFFQKQA